MVIIFRRYQDTKRETERERQREKDGVDMNEKTGYKKRRIESF